MSAAGKALSKILDSAEGWSADDYRISHAPSKTSWWVANTWLSFDGSGNTPYCLGFWERWWLSRKAKKLRSLIVAAKIYKGQLTNR